MYFSSSNDPFSDYEYLVYDFLGANLRIMVYNADIIFDSDKLKPMI